MCHIYDGRKRTYESILVFNEHSKEKKYLKDLIPFSKYYLLLAKVYITPGSKINEINFFAIKELLTEHLDAFTDEVMKVCDDCLDWAPSSKVVPLLEGLMADIIFEIATVSKEHEETPFLVGIDEEERVFIYSAVPE